MLTDDRYKHPIAARIYTLVLQSGVLINVCVATSFAGFPISLKVCIRWAVIDAGGTVDVPFAGVHAVGVRVVLHDYTI